ncbi:hypothetical protein KKB44_02930 [Candidatus Micrarchaeota archaeon]|nr:hypothetical protein [Candidatus Micrarchaeota archaeon]
MVDNHARIGGQGSNSLDTGQIIPKGAPKHMRRKIKGTVEQLIKDGYILSKPTSYGLEVSLNFERKNEIFDIIEKWKLKK